MKTVLICFGTKIVFGMRWNRSLYGSPVMFMCCTFVTLYEDRSASYVDIFEVG